MRSEVAEIAMAISSVRRQLSVMAVQCQASSLLGCLESLGPGGMAAVGRHHQASEIERRWRLEVRAHSLATRQGWAILRMGFAKVD